MCPPRLTSALTALALLAGAVACASRQSSMDRLNAQPPVEYRGHYTAGPRASWFRPCTAAAADSAWWVTITGDAMRQLDEARRDGRLRDGRPTFVHWRAVMTRGGEVGPRGPGAPALLVRDLVAIGGPEPADCPAPAASGAAASLVEDARAFMSGYARDLLAGDRAAIAARYDRTGAYILGNGRKEFLSHDSIAAIYRGAGWSPPASFEWRDLSFEPVGPDAVVVAGRFAWGVRGAPAPIVFSYTGLLRRQDGALRIRLEDESADPRTLPPPARADSVPG